MQDPSGYVCSGAFPSGERGLRKPKGAKIPLTWFMACIQAPRIILLTTPDGPRPVRSCHQVYWRAVSRSRTSLMMLNCVRTDADSGVAPFPSSAARTSRASSYFPLRIKRRGESGRKGHIIHTNAVKTGVIVSGLVSHSKQPRNRKGVWWEEQDQNRAKRNKELTALESQWEAPCNAAGCKRKPQSQPVRDTKSGDAVGHLNDD